MAYYQIKVDVTVHDREKLAAFAKSRALNHCAMPEQEFVLAQADAYEQETEIEFWLGWAFDAGTPPDCGFQIEESTVTNTALD